MTVALVAMVACRSHALPPPDSGPPDVVLGAYLVALRDCDCDAARALATSTFFVGNGELWGAVHVSAYAPPIGPAGTLGEAVFSTNL